MVWALSYHHTILSYPVVLRKKKLLKLHAQWHWSWRRRKANRCCRAHLLMRVKSRRVNNKMMSGLWCLLVWFSPVSVLFLPLVFVCLFVLEGAECLKRLPTKLLMSVYLHSLGPFQLYRFLQADLRSLGWDWPSTEMHQKYHRQSTLPRPTMTSPYQEKVW